MTRRKLIALLASITNVFIIFAFYSSIDSSQILQALPQRIGLGDARLSSISLTLPTDPEYAKWNPTPSYNKGSPMPPGHNYSSTLVIAKTKDEDVNWMYQMLPDQHKAIYTVNDPIAPLHPPKNKAHEVMVYLSWIIDNYDNLPDVAIFMHAHQLAWHNDEMLNSDAALMITRLSRQRVWREGFVNMRCSWYPGCPDWMHPGETEENDFKQEEVLLAKSWSELFPLDEVPSVLAQPCCAQFALSKERIQAKPYAQYVWYRDWVFNTKLPDHLSGRIWEYVWQFVFTGESVYCPKEHVCFCDQYATCFGGEDQYADYVALKNDLGDRERELSEWKDKKTAVQEAEAKGEHDKLATLEKPEQGKDGALQTEIDRLRPMVDKLKHDAQERGKDPRNRAKEAGREWHDGDDF